MNSAKTSPYGTWNSSLTTEMITSSDSHADFVDILVDPVRKSVYHIEKRPSEGGRNTLLHTESGRDLTGAPWDVKTAVNGYGGGAAIIHGGVVYFSHVRDGRVYRVDVDANSPEVITPENTFHKFADFNVYPPDPTIIVSVLEDHTGCTFPSTVVTSLCILNTSTKTVSPLISSASFYGFPKFSPNGNRLAWIQWELPDMPWIGSEIWVADVSVTASHSLALHNAKRLAGEKGKISVAYPSWISQDVLLFTSDISGFSNPWKYDCGTGVTGPVLLAPMTESFSYGLPPKCLGWSPYAVVDSHGSLAIFTAIRDGRSVLYLVNISNGTAQLLVSPYVDIEHIRSLSPEKGQVVFVGSKADAAPALVQCSISGSSASPKPAFIDLQSGSQGLPLPLDYISLPKPMSLLPDGATEVHVVYYAPTNPEYVAPDGEKPPCVLNVHGGPVSFSGQSFNSSKQFFTTRGWAWLDVNYGGSSGFGRAYMERLRGNWGVVDVDDCIHAAQILSSLPHNLIDPKRIVVRGGSAGGFTVLTALSIRAETKTFVAGTSLYGISDLRRLAGETHKFESGYLEMLFGDNAQALTDRSPIFYTDKIVAPLLILQGADDKVVPKSQAEGIVDVIRKRGRVVEYQLYQDEGHGWARKETIEDALLREIQFYNRVLGLELNQN